jgi:hypothetical protein
MKLPIRSERPESAMTALRKPPTPVAPALALHSCAGKPAHGAEPLLRVSTEYASSRRLVTTNPWCPERTATSTTGR